MKSSIPEYYVDDAEKLINICSTITKDDPFLGRKDIFFRGVSNFAFKLVPSIAREGNERMLQFEDEAIREALKQFPETILGTTKAAIADVVKECRLRYKPIAPEGIDRAINDAEIEKEVLKNHSLRFSTKNIYTDPVTLFDLAILQHYGFPTRLLDITTELSVATFFACHDCFVNTTTNGLIYVFDQSLTKTLRRIDITNIYRDYVAETSPFAFRLNQPFFRDECQYGDFIFVPDNRSAAENTRHTLMELEEKGLVKAKVIVDGSAKLKILNQFNACKHSTVNFKTIYADAVEACFKSVAQAFRVGETLW